MKKKPTKGPPPWHDLAQGIANQADTDIFLYSGGIDPPSDDAMAFYIQKCKSRTNAMLMLTTYGGNPHTAYRIARCFQRNYSGGKFILFIDTVCKSAGTLIALGSDELVMSDGAELGPLDVQISKHDEVGEFSSGLTPTQTFGVLKQEAFNSFQDHFKRLRERIGCPTKIAANVAARLTVGLFSPIYAQIDPMRIGEIARSLMIGKRYGERLGKNTDNVKEDTLDRLLATYPSHSFVIDREEAESLFSEVRVPTTQEMELMRCLDEVVAKGQENDRKDEPAVVTPVSFPERKDISDDNQDTHQGQEPGLAQSTRGEGLADLLSLMAEEADRNLPKVSPSKPAAIRRGRKTVSK